MSWFRRRARAPEPPPRVDAATEQAFDAWRNEVYGDGYMVWHDGADADEALRRWLADREGTEAMLLAGLATDDNATADVVEYLAEKGHPPGPDVVAELVAATDPARPSRIRVPALRAAWVVTHDPVFVRSLVEVLRSGTSDEDARMGAARALALAPPTAEVADVLAAAIAHDRAYLVRIHAVHSLRRLAGDAEPDRITRAEVETISERGTAAGRAAFARDLRAGVRTVDT